jgi:hypothetical protein
VSKMKNVSLSLMLALSSGLLLAGCNKTGSAAAELLPRSGSAADAGRPAVKGAADPVLTKEEVGAVLGHPVTTIDGKGTNLTYKTDVLGLETGIEVEHKRSVKDAVQVMAGSRTATKFLGGVPEDVPGLGDEAFFGAMSILYVRKASDVITIQPPNLQQVAGFEAYGKVRDAKFGSDEQRQAMEALAQTEKTDPLTAGLQGGDATEGALAVIKASSKKQGTQHETDARAMAQALAKKLLEKL